MNGEFWHTDPAKAETKQSYLTGRQILLNRDPSRLLLTPSWSPSALRLAMDECRSSWLQETTLPYRPSPNGLAPLLSAFAAALSIQDFGAAIDAVFAHRSIWGVLNPNSAEIKGTGWRLSDRSRIADLLIACWRHDLVAWPDEEPPVGRMTFTDLTRFGRCADFFATYMQILDGLSDLSALRQNFATMLLRRSGLRAVGDLTPDVVDGAIRRDFKTSPVLTAKALTRLQVDAHGYQQITHTADRFGPFGRAAQRSRGGDSFEWATNADPTMEAWRQMAANCLSEAVRNKTGWRRGINAFLQYLIDTPALPRDPMHYLSGDIAGVAPYAHSDRMMHNKAVEFLNWMLSTQFTDEDDHGRPICLPGLYNPMKAKTSHGEVRTETGREAMPTRFLHMLAEILTENNWAFAKRFERLGRSDFFPWMDRNTGDYTQTWSPVRAYLVWLKLRMPFRTFQIRYLDSGEADTMRFDRQTETMVRNTGHLASGSAAAPVDRGVLQMIWDGRAGRAEPFLRISTNKTADINKDAWNRGYDCPYAPSDVIALLASLRDWQENHNPLNSAVAWAEVPELVERFAAQQLEGMSSCFLFRDPCDKNSALPISNGRVRVLWLNLIEELEKRLDAQGITMPDGRPYQLVVSRTKDGRPASVVYDLHGLRVSLITAFYESGVPAEVLMKIVGHATVVMTLYYTKLGVAHITDIMTEAQARLLCGEQEAWARFQRQRQFDDLKQVVAANDDAGIIAFESGSGASLIFMDIGICPVGGARCDTGGPALPRDKEYGPVPGGRTNCAACRYFVSGPPFLHGLVAHFNALSQTAADKSGRRRALESLFEELDAARRAAAFSGEPFLGHREWHRASVDLDEITDALDQTLLRMNALVRIIDQSRRILSATPDNSTARATALVVSDLGAVEAAFEETTEFDLVDQICQSSTFFPAINPTTANVRRMRAYDRMLVRHGLEAAFLDLDEATSLRVGNALSRLLAARVGRQGTVNLIEGESTLSRLGFTTAAFAEQFGQIVGHPLQLRGGTAIVDSAQDMEAI